MAINAAKINTILEITKKMKKKNGDYFVKKWLKNLEISQKITNFAQ